MLSGRLRCDICVVVPVRLDADHNSTWNMPHQHVINFFGRVFIAAIERRQGLRIGCLEEISWRKRWINDENVLKLADGMGSSGYAGYLRALISEQRGS
mgnify:CR=1 FL=1